MTASPTVAELKKESFLHGYTGSTGIYDEMLDDSRALRPHWQMFVNLLDDLGWPETRKRWEQAKRVIHENGVTYNVYGDPQGIDRPWNLDAVPVLVRAEDWRSLERGLTQRARVLDLILADLYGPQTLLREGLIPPELVLGNPGFLRPLHGAKPSGNRWLHLHSVDLGRSADGQVWAITDRTQAPSGAGYALENRIVLSRALPDVFRDCQVLRLATFFRSMQKMLTQFAPKNHENPRIVVLTPGPYNETYFEHAYLARYLGYTLVEGADLTVRDHRVFLKTLGGLQAVDVILRRLDDDFCDPLELRNNSTLGIAGLVEAVHHGNVTVANALGSGLLETRALPAFLPHLCKHLLGEDLLLPSVATWWCGQDQAMQHVIANINRLVIKRTFPSRGRETVFGQDLSQKQRDELIARIRSCPTDYVAQEQLTFSTAPVLVNNHLEPRRGVLRAHLTANSESYSLMPGGLARFGATPESLNVSMQKGGGSKDVWVLADGPVDTFSLLKPLSKPVVLTRGGGELPSRVAENLFWLGRYIERAEGLARLMRGVVVRLIDQSGVGSPPELIMLFSALSGGKALMSIEAGDFSIPEGDLLATIFDANKRGSLKAVLIEAHRLARILRDRISLDTWRIVNNLDQDFLKPYQAAHTNQLSEVLGLLDRMIITLAAFGGLAMDSMTRGQSWRFLDMGRRIERSLNAIRLLQGTLVDVMHEEATLLEAVLEIADSAMTYRRRYLTSLQVHAVLDLLVCDETNPRSIAFQMAAMAEHVDHLPHATDGSPRTPEQQILIRCLTGLRLIDIESESAEVVGGQRVKVREVLGVVSDHLAALSDSIGHSYFSHATLSRQPTVQAQAMIKGGQN